MNDVAASVDVRVPAMTAYEQWTRVESFPAFMPGVVAVEQLGHRTSHWVTEVAGAHREFDAEVVEQRPGERIAWRSTGGDVRHRGAVTFQPISAGETRVTVDLAWEPRRLAEKVCGVFGFDRFQVKADLLRFKRFIEGRAASAGRRTPASAGAPVDAATSTAAKPQVARVFSSGGRPLAHDVVDILRTQHQEVRRMLVLTDAATGTTKEQHFRQLAELLKTHERGEQEVVHPVTHSLDCGIRTAASRLAEEREADRLIARLERTAVDTPEFDRWFDRLREAVLTHAEQEEMEEFPMLRQHVAADRLWDMADELLAAQQRPS